MYLMQILKEKNFNDYKDYVLTTGITGVKFLSNKPDYPTITENANEYLNFLNDKLTAVHTRLTSEHLAHLVLYSRIKKVQSIQLILIQCIR